MDGVCLRYTELPGTSRLFADYLYDFGKVARFYRHAPRDASSFAASLKEIQYPDARRAALISALSKINSPGSPNLKKLAQPGTVCVVTGQQVGLFTGPAYTVFKAVTAAAAARELTANGTPAVPVFWLATEDHDFPEIAAAHVFDSSSSVQTLKVSTSGAVDRPVGGIVPDGGFPLDALETALQGLPFADEVISLVREAHAGNPSMGAAFRESLRRLLAPLDLIFLDPLEPEIRTIGAPFLHDAVLKAGDLYPKLLDRNRDLLASFLKDNLPAIRLTPCDATYLAWLDVSALKLDNPGQFFEQHGLGLADGAQYGAPAGKFVRLNFGCPRATLTKALARMQHSVAAR